MQITVMMLRSILLIGDFPPVEAFTLLLPYPPKAGSAIKQPPTAFAVPSATSSLFALTDMPLTPSRGPSPRPLAATDDSKKPRSAMTKEVLIAVRTCFIWSNWNGHLKANNPLGLFLAGPNISSPCLSQPNFHVKTAEKMTISARSGK